MRNPFSDLIPNPFEDLLPDPPGSVGPDGTRYNLPGSLPDIPGPPPPQSAPLNPMFQEQESLGEIPWLAGRGSVGQELRRLEMIKQLGVNPAEPAYLEALSRARTVLEDYGYKPGWLESMGHQVRSGLMGHGTSTGTYTTLGDVTRHLADSTAKRMANGQDRAFPPGTEGAIRKASTWLSDLGDKYAVNKAYDEIMAVEGRPDGLMGETVAAIAAIPDMAMTILLTALTRNPNVGLSAMGLQVAADEYGRSRHLEGKSEGASAWDALKAATYEVAPEKVFGVLEPIAKSLPKDVWKGVLKSAALEIPSEVTTESLNILDEIATSGHIPPWFETALRQAKAGYAGGIMGLGMGGMGGAVRTVVDYRARNDYNRKFDAFLEEVAQDSAIKAQSPSGGISQSFDEGFHTLGMPESERTESFDQLDDSLRELFGTPRNIIGDIPLEGGHTVLPDFPNAPTGIPFLDRAVIGAPAIPEPLPAPEPEEAELSGEQELPQADPVLYKRGGTFQAVRLPNGNWMLRSKEAGRWQPWEERSEFDPDPVLGYTPDSRPRGGLRVPGHGWVKTNEPYAEYEPGAKPPPDLLRDIAKGPGLNREAWAANGFSDYFGVRPEGGSATEFVFRKEGGLTPDYLREWMVESGYLRDASWEAGGQQTTTQGDAMELVLRALRGERVVSPANSQAEADYRARMAQENERDRPPNQFEEETGSGTWDVVGWDGEIIEEGFSSRTDAVEYMNAEVGGPATVQQAPKAVPIKEGMLEKSKFVEGVVSFRSALSSINDLRGGIDANVPVGVALPDMSKKAQTELAAAVEGGHWAFVDSGAFGAFKKAQAALKDAGNQASRTAALQLAELDFDRVIQRYDSLIESAGPGAAGLHLVAPDVVGNQERTVELQEEYAEDLQSLAERATLIVPVQRSEQNTFEGIPEHLERVMAGKPYRLGIPAQEKAMKPEEIRALLKNWDGPAPEGVHFLGIAANKKKLSDLRNIVREAWPGTSDPIITSDASRLAAKMGQISETRKSEVDEKSTEAAQEEYGEQSMQDWEPALVDRMAASMEISAAELQRRIDREGDGTYDSEYEDFGGSLYDWIGAKLGHADLASWIEFNHSRDEAAKDPELRGAARRKAVAASEEPPDSPQGDLLNAPQAPAQAGASTYDAKAEEDRLEQRADERAAINSEWARYGEAFVDEGTAQAEQEQVPEDVAKQAPEDVAPLEVGDIVRLGKDQGVVLRLDGEVARFHSDSMKNPKAYVNVPANRLTFEERPGGDGASFSRAAVSTKKGKMGVNLRGLVPLLGSSMYRSNLADVAAKELLQNSFDAAKAAVKDGKVGVGKVNIDVSQDKREITVTDNGSGMTPQIVEDAFFTIAGTDKGSLDAGEASGGLGLAKVGFMLSASYVKLKTTRDGITTEVTATSEDILNGEFDINTYEAEPGDAGTAVTVGIPEHYSDGDKKKSIWMPWAAESLDFLQEPLIHGDVEFTYTQDGGTEAPLNLGKNYKDEGTPFLTTVKFDWGEADVYFGIDRLNNAYGEHKVLSSGLFQFNHNFKLKATSYDRIPHRIVVNIKPSVDTRHPDYPFNNQREGFRSRAEADVEKLRRYLANIALGRQAEQTAEAFEDILSMPFIEGEQTPEQIAAQVQKRFNKQRPEKTESSATGAVPKTVVITDRGVESERGEVLLDTEKEKAEEKARAGGTFEADKAAPRVEQFLKDMDADPANPIFHNNTDVNWATGFSEYGDAPAFFAEMGSILVEMRDEMARSGVSGYDTLSGDNLVYAGVSIDKGYAGVYVRVPYSGIFLNPLHSGFGDRNLFGAQTVMYNTMTHELAHHVASNHDAAFNTQQLMIEAHLANEGLRDYFMGRILDTLTRHESVFAAMREEYEKSTTRNKGASLAELKGNSAIRADERAAGRPGAPSRPVQRVRRNQQRETVPRSAEASQQGGQRGGVLQAPGQTDRLHAEDVEAAVRRAVGNRADMIEVVQTQDDIKGEGLQRFITQSQQKLDTLGLLDPATGKIYLIADNIADADKAAWTAWHELFHRGARVAYSDVLHKTLDEAAQNRVVSRLASRIYDQRGLADEVSSGMYTERQARLTSIDEALAELEAARRTGDFAQFEERYRMKVPAEGGWQQMVDRWLQAIKRVLGKLGVDIEADTSLDRVWEIIGTASDQSGGMYPTRRQRRQQPAAQTDFSVEPFFSALNETVQMAQGMPKKGKGVQFIQWLDGQQKRGNIKKEERDWMGVDEWLRGKDVVTRDELQRFVSQNSVRLEERMLSEDYEFLDSDFDVYPNLTESFDGDGAGISYTIDNWGENKLTGETDGPLIPYMETYAELDDLSVPHWSTIRSEVSEEHGVTLTPEEAQRVYEVATYAARGMEQESEGPAITWTGPLHGMSPAAAVRAALQEMGAKDDQRYEIETPQGWVRLEYEPETRTWSLTHRHGNNWTLLESAHADETREWLSRDGETEGHFVWAEDVLTEGGFLDVSGSGGTQYGAYTEDGGENYVELLIKLPADPGGRPVDVISIAQDRGYEIDSVDGYMELPEAVRNSITEEAKDNEYKNHGDYESAHWDDPNVVVHIRFKTRTGPNGERILAIEEVQSDWHQEGRKKGYGGEGTPDGPFKKSWPLLGMKRAIRYAAENGYDGIAWTPGQIHVDRYNLEQVVSEVSLSASGDGKYRLVLQDKNGFELDGYRGSGREVTKEELDATVGTELAGKLIAGAEENRGREWRPDQKLNPEYYTIKGADLEVGGKGMINFYDRELRREVAKFTKKWGAKPGAMPVSGAKEDIHAGKVSFRNAEDARAFQGMIQNLTPIDSSKYRLVDDGVAFQFDPIPAEHAEKLKNAHTRFGFVWGWGVRKVGEREGSAGEWHYVPVTPKMAAAARGGFPMFQKDLLGGPTSKERVDDKGRRVKDRLAGKDREYVEVDEGPGDLFGGDPTTRGQQDLFNEEAQEEESGTQRPLLHTRAPVQQGTWVSEPLTKKRAFALKWNRWMKTAGNLPDKVFKAKNMTDAMKGAEELHAKHLMVDLKRAVRAGYGKSLGRLSASEKAKINDYLAGNQQVNVPQAVKDAIDPMRRYLDRLSQQLLNSGIFDPNSDLGTKVRDNMGTYLTRSYQVFDDPKWANKVPDAVRQRAFTYLKQQAIAQNRWQSLTPLEMNDKINGIINNILFDGTASEGPIAFLSKTTLGAKDLKMLLKRKDIAPAIRALMGEYQDPAVNFTRTAVRMQNAVANHVFLQNVRQGGMGSLFFEDKVGRFAVQIEAAPGTSMSPLSGLYTTPEIKKAFEEALDPQVMAPLLRGIIGFNSLVKYGKTVVAPTTMLRNYWSAFFFSVANGHMIYPADIAGIAKSSATLWGELRGKRGRRDYMRKLKRLGVTLDNPHAGEMLAALGDTLGPDTQVGGTAKRGARTFFGKLTNLYQHGDDFWKIVGFEAEKRALMKYGMGQAAAEREAASRIRDTYPTYSQVNKFIRSLRVFPLAGTFVSFPAEIIRTTKNMAKMAYKDAKAGRKELAAKRVAGMVFASSWAAAVSALSMAWLGLDDEDDDAIRKLAAPWTRNSNLLYYKFTEEGFPRYMDLSYLDPYNYLKRPVNALLTGGSMKENLLGPGMLSGEGSALRDILDPFFGEDIAWQAFTEILANKKRTGGKVYNTEGGFWVRNLQKANHLRKQVQPGVVSNAERMWKAARGDVSRGGREYNLQDESIALGGFRFVTMNPRESALWVGYGFAGRKREATSLLSYPVGGQNKVSDREIRSAFTGMMAARERIWSETIDKVELLKGMMPEKELWKILNSSGISKADTTRLIRGDIPKWRPSQQFLKNTKRRAILTASEERREEVRAMYKHRIDLVYQLVDEYYN